MMLYRSLVVGLLGAIALLLAEQGATLERIDHRAAAVALPSDVDADAEGVELEPTTIVHISRSGAGEDPTEALGLGAHDRVVTIDGQPVEKPWRLAVCQRWFHALPGSYFELWVRGPTMRRMLVLVTP